MWFGNSNTGKKYLRKLFQFIWMEHFQCEKRFDHWVSADLINSIIGVWLLSSTVPWSLWIAHMTTDHLWWRSRGSLLCNRTGFYGYATLVCIRLWKRSASWGVDEWGRISPTESVVQVQRINFVVFVHAWTHKKVLQTELEADFCTCVVLLWCSCSLAGFK